MYAHVCSAKYMGKGVKTSKNQYNKIKAPTIK